MAKTDSAGMVVVTDLRKTYRDVVAVDRLTFSVREGEVFGLLGPNGAGKSTAVRILATLTSPDSGAARVAGVDVVRDPARARRMIGYVPQASGVDREATARENLRLQGQLQGLRGRELRVRVDEVLDLLGLRDVAGRVVDTYSGGMKRRLDIGLGIIHRPRIVLLDEPTTGLDPEVRASIWRELESLSERERLTVLLTSHYLEEVDRLATQLAIMLDGRVAVSGTPDELKSSMHGDTVTIDLDDGQPDVALTIIRGMTSITDAVRHGPSIRAHVSRGGEMLPVILGRLHTAGITVRSVGVARPSLDDVYLRAIAREPHDRDVEVQR